MSIKIFERKNFFRIFLCYKNAMASNPPISVSITKRPTENPIKSLIRNLDITLPPKNKGFNNIVDFLIVSYTKI